MPQLAKTAVRQALALCLLLLALGEVRGQQAVKNAFDEGRLAIEAGVKYGKIFKHTPLFKPEVTELTGLYELGVSVNTGGRRLWHQLHGYPIFGLTFIHARYGDAHIFGRGYALVPSLAFLTRTKHINLHYKLGLGAAYLTKTYNRITNPENNVIGSRLNNATMFAFGFEWKMMPRLRLLGTLSFTHFSNGKVQSPNLGINVPAWGFSLKYYPRKPNYTPARFEELPAITKKLRINLRLGIAWNESGIPGATKSAVYDVSAYVSRRINLQGQLFAGLEMNYYKGIYRYVINNVTARENKAAQAVKLAPFVGYELFFGHVSALFQLGAYVYDPFLQRGPIPAKLGLQYYARPTYSAQRNNFFAGIYLKSHYSKADYIELAVGYVF